jgi:putative tryptophan/tyrosine transport system substrate-binding protein
MRRRDFITLLGGAALAWPLVSRAQQAGKIPRIAFLRPDRTAPATNSYYAAFSAQLEKHGFREGQNIVNAKGNELMRLCSGGRLV